MTTEQHFHEAMLALYDRAAEHGYRAKIFLDMTTKMGGLRTARVLLRKPGPQAGLLRLKELDLLRISMENQVLNPRFEALFTDSERREARERLQALEFTPGGWE